MLKVLEKTSGPTGGMGGGFYFGRLCSPYTYLLLVLEQAPLSSSSMVPSRGSLRRYDVQYLLTVEAPVSLEQSRITWCGWGLGFVRSCISASIFALSECTPLFFGHPVLGLKFGLRFMRQQGQRLRAFMLRTSFPEISWTRMRLPCLPS